MEGSPKREERSIDPHKTLEAEAYGEKTAYDVDSGDVEAGGQFMTWNLKLRKWAGKYGTEEGGIERIPAELRTNQSPVDMFTLFMSANICTATAAVGILGPELFELGWWDSFLSVLFFNLVGAIPPALIAIWGPKLGLRTMVAQRYSFGWWPTKLIAILQVINMIGWAMVNCIAGAVILYDVGQGKLPISVAVLILGLVSCLIAVTGYKYVHMYERFSWIVMAICFVIVAGFGGKDFVNVPMATGATATSGVLSFGTVIWAFQVSWGTLAADYGVYMREDRKSFAVFFWTFSGIFLGCFLPECLGIALMTATSGSDAYEAAFEAANLGGLIGQTFEGHGTGIRNFGFFIETLLSISVVATVVANIYSLGLDVQVIHPSLIKVPRIVWTVIGGIIFLAAAMAGRNQLETVMENFLNVIAYWVTPWLVVFLLEHIVWRRGWNYDLKAWNDESRLPKGYAAFTAFIIATVIGILCMSQTWWVGPIALAVGNAPFGTDISWMMELGVTTVLYLPLRWLERRYFGL